MTRSAQIILALIVPAAVGCGGASASMNASSSTPSTSKPAPAQPAATTAATAAAGDRALRRTAIRAAVNGGLGLFLQKVVLDDQPVMKGGKFYGFRVTSLTDPGFWSGVDLKPGDVVTRVNGMPIEHPEEALEAFHSLGVASELRVAYDRDGQARELRYPIVDDEQKRADASAP
jgi:type II secretory pathway component PulC